MLTEEEHEARAMLLGRIYDEDLETYEILAGVDLNGGYDEAIDANTLEHLPEGEWMRRYNAWCNLLEFTSDEQLCQFGVHLDPPKRV